MSKPILCLDFDGVIHSYTTKWEAAHIIPDPPVPGAIDFIVRAMVDFRVAIYSSRSNQLGGLIAMREWMRRNFDREKYMPHEIDAVMKLIEWPTAKPPAFVTIDDRAITFDGTWPALDTLRNFKPWNK